MMLVVYLTISCECRPDYMVFNSISSRVPEIKDLDRQMDRETDYYVIPRGLNFFHYRHRTLTVVSKLVIVKSDTVSIQL